MAVLLSASTRAEAQTSREGDGGSGAPLVMLNETARVTDVVDSFDQGSSFSVRLSAGYLYSNRSAQIERELRVSDARGLGTTQFAHVADAQESTHSLLVGAEIGLFRDLALTIGAPIVLSNRRQLRLPAGADAQAVNDALRDGWSHNGQPTTLFSPNFDSPERSGVDQIRLGLQWAVFNQRRDPSRPTWMVGFEWRPPVGAALSACQATSGGTVCPNPADVPALPPGGGSASSGAAPSRANNAAYQPGISRGVHGIYFQTMLSRRIGYLEPYAGFDILAEFPTRESPFRYLDTPYGMLATFPPIVSSLTVGTEIIPWENRETWQRLVIDLRVRGTYRSQGRDYSMLYDALGTSTSRALLAPGCPSNVRGNDGSCQPGREVYFDGLTGTASHVVIAGGLGITVQPAKFLRFSLGGNFAWISPHLLTNTDACNPNTQPPADHPEWRGGCVSNSAPDPQHRPVIDQPGGRFRSTSDTQFDIYASIALTPRF
ncbi:MAG: hypothetical protein JNK72_22725 [Myxococcales bacterium]|nr:hypothetical protein [Myxococcales bacterium]